MKNKNVKVESFVSKKGNKRRQFLKMSGLAIAGSGLILSCSDDDDFTEPIPDSNTFDLGGGDLGVLNYAYALEQLEAEFYTKVVNGSYWSGAAMEEKQILEDLYNHEVNHREFFKAALNANFDAEVVLPESYVTTSPGKLKSIYLSEKQPLETLHQRHDRWTEALLRKP